MRHVPLFFVSARLKQVQMVLSFAPLFSSTTPHDRLVPALAGSLVLFVPSFLLSGIIQFSPPTLL